MKPRIGGGPRKISTSASRAVLESDTRLKKKKKRVVDDEEVTDVEIKGQKKLSKALASLQEETRSKKKTTGREVAVVKASSSGKELSIKERTAVKSFFGERSEAIFNMLEAGENDSGLSVLKKSLLQTVIRVLPDAENLITETKGQKGTYQFVTLISQLRELIADMEADRDRAYIAQSLLDTVIRPAMMDITQNLLMKHHEFRKRTEDHIASEHRQKHSADLMALAKDLANDMTITYRDVSTKLIEALKT